MGKAETTKVFQVIMDKIHFYEKTGSGRKRFSCYFFQLNQH